MLLHYVDMLLCYVDMFLHYVDMLVHYVDMLLGYVDMLLCWYLLMLCQNFFMLCGNFFLFCANIIIILNSSMTNQADTEIAWWIWQIFILLCKERFRMWGLYIPNFRNKMSTSWKLANLLQTMNSEYSVSTPLEIACCSVTESEKVCKAIQGPVIGFNGWNMQY